MLLGDNGETNNCFLLTTSVLDFTIQLVENGGENDLVSVLVVFSLQYVLVNHMHWKYKMKYIRWKVTLKIRICPLGTKRRLDVFTVHARKLKLRCHHLSIYRPYVQILPGKSEEKAVLKAIWFKETT